MTIKHPVVSGLLALCILFAGGLFVFAAGGIVARYQISPLVAVVDAAEGNVKTLVQSLKGEADNEEFVTSAYYHLKIRTYETSDDGEGDKVAFVRMGDGYLVGTRAGNLYLAQLRADDQVAVETLAATVPTNKDEFLEDTEDYNFRLHIQFGVKDLFLQGSGDELRLYATYHHWYRDARCAVLRLSVLGTSTENLLADATNSGEWSTIFESQPCMDLNNKLDHNNHNNAFLQSGGRLDLLNDSNLLMTVGEHFFDSIHNKDLVQDPTASYGKMMLINLQDNSASVFSLGHRNAQGLYVASDGNIWSTEHGPRGGDELNLIERGNNYGWPQVSYGTDYEDVVWPEHLDWAGHEGYHKPVFAWLPSIATNNLIRLENSGFPLWEGNLMIASLRDQAIHRMVLEDKHVLVTERIHIGSRVRDLMQTEDGNLLLLTDDGKLVLLEALSESDPDQQLSVAMQASQLWVQCDSCHSLVPDAGHSVGPNLHNIVGSEIGRFDDYAYSQALSELEGNWTPETLDKFLRDPGAFAPGTAMMFPGLDDEADRQMIIEYLQSR